MATVLLKDVTKQFGQNTVVQSLNVEIPDRSFVSLVGPSGCGKTTTLRMIAGLERGHNGEIWFNRERVDHLPAHHRDIAMVFQSYALYPHMDVGANMGFPLRMMGMAKAKIGERVLLAAQRLNLVALLDRKPRELSGGQRQRVAIGRAMVRDASVFLMDEPLSNLDAQLRVEMRAQIRRLHHELQRTFIYVTHDQAEALTMSDLVAVMNNGTLQQIGSPAEIYNRPANLMVAGFIGSPQMNFFHGEVRGAAGVPCFHDDQSDIIFPLAAYTDVVRVGQSLVVGIRPETVTVLEPATGGTGTVSASANVFVVETLGSDIYLTMRSGDRFLRVRTGAERSFAIGNQLECTFDLTRLHVFDKATQAAVLPTLSIGQIFEKRGSTS